MGQPQRWSHARDGQLGVRRRSRTTSPSRRSGCGQRWNGRVSITGRSAFTRRCGHSGWQRRRRRHCHGSSATPASPRSSRRRNTVPHIGGSSSPLRTRAGSSMEPNTSLPVVANASSSNSSTTTQGSRSPPTLPGARLRPARSPSCQRASPRTVFHSGCSPITGLR
jgi:hypothetical protein